MVSNQHSTRSTDSIIVSGFWESHRLFYGTTEFVSPGNHSLTKGLNDPDPENDPPTPENKRDFFYNKLIHPKLMCGNNKR